MIDTVIFDIGMVLLGFDPRAHLRRLFPDDAATAQAVWDAIWASGLWTALDGGADTAETLARMRALAPGREAAVELAFARAGECLYRFDYAEPWLRELRARGLRLYYLSNYSDHTTRCAPEKLDFLRHMDGGVFSWREKLLKPDPAIYRLLCKRFSLIPARCVFLDDRPENVQGARDCGMRAILFEGYETARESLQRMLQ